MAYATGLRLKATGLWVHGFELPDHQGVNGHESGGVPQMLLQETVGMAWIDEQEAAHGFTFYTYTYNDLRKCARQYYQTLEEARRDLIAFRASLIAEEGRRELLKDMKIVRLRTRPITRKALVDLFNDIDGNFGGFITSREVVEVIYEPQVPRRFDVVNSGG